MKKVIKWIIGLNIFLFMNYIVANAFSALATDVGYADYLLGKNTIIYFFQEKELHSVSFKGYALVFSLSSLLSLVYLLIQAVLRVIKKNKILKKENDSLRATAEKVPFNEKLQKMEHQFIIKSKDFISKVSSTKVIGIQLYKYDVRTIGNLIEVSIKFEDQIINSSQSLSTRTTVFHFDRELFLDLQEKYSQSSLDSFISNNIQSIATKTYTPKNKKELGLFFLLRVASSLSNTQLTDPKYKAWLHNIKDNGKIEGVIHSYLSQKPYVFSNGSETREYVCFHHPEKEFADSYIIIVAFEKNYSHPTNLTEKTDNFRAMLSF
ncbi:hypothetical protein G3A_17470 [Bacillus sp. 17376]|uniref:Uncharacterized protein n=1 Tax=Mesobacillus boroniphilus JCM 21738 TaxID=1294265 RepID=W4RUP2_9BACI|nr:hypothetical protein [Mesobacillus boroniphilus]ESU31298.1 hypothetical protein G3A_17470 [Bacillus sp. 17376]GAE48140.1 hypothetical protein JCM21738_5221 [Mesobacillus boroniphilus JCM 21738]